MNCRLIKSSYFDDIPEASQQVQGRQTQIWNGAIYIHGTFIFETDVENHGRGKIMDIVCGMYWTGDNQQKRLYLII